MILAVDPGVHACGISLWSSTNTLIVARIVRSYTAPNASRGETWECMSTSVRSAMPELEKVTELAVEVPQVYMQSRSPGDRNDLIDVAAVVGAICGQFTGRKITTYLPASWKGQVPKKSKSGENIIAHRCVKRLSPTELNNVVEAGKTLMHNVWDAIGLGLFHLKRLG